MGVCVLGVLFFNKIPYLNRVSGKYKRFFIKCNFLRLSGNDSYTL